MAILANATTVSFKLGEDAIPGLKSLPDFAENKEQVEVTCLSDVQKKYIAGLKDYGELSYTFNYDKEAASKVKELGDSEVTVTVTLADGTTVTYKATCSLTINAASSGAVMEMTVNTIITGDFNITFTK